MIFNQALERWRPGLDGLLDTSAIRLEPRIRQAGTMCLPKPTTLMGIIINHTSSAMNGLRSALASSGIVLSISHCLVTRN